MTQLDTLIDTCHYNRSSFTRSTRIMRWGVVALGALILCSCRSALPWASDESPASPPPFTDLDSVQDGASRQPAPKKAQAPVKPKYDYNAANNVSQPGVSPPPSPALPYPAETQHPAANASMIAQVNHNEPVAGEPAGAAPYCPPGQAPIGGPTAGIAPGHVMPGGAVIGHPVAPNYPGAMLPMEATTGPAVPYTQWHPPHLYGNRPRDEYLFDGGDRNREVNISKAWNVRGLDTEDTVAHFDTLDGRTIVEPSNRVPVYAPRFASVRKVVGLEMNRVNQFATGVDRPSNMLLAARTGNPTTVLQPTQLGQQNGLHNTTVFRERQPGHEALAKHLANSLDAVDSHLVDFQIFHQGKFELASKPRLAEALDAAVYWTEEESVQVVIDGKAAKVEQNVDKLQMVYSVARSPGQPKLEITKVASKGSARPGEVIEFVLRFKNTGDELIGNVTLLDNLTARLEYIQRTQSCSLKHDFLIQENEVDSSVLRWEIHEPMKPGDTGVIRFKCKVL